MTKAEKIMFWLLGTIFVLSAINLVISYWVVNFVKEI